jgi:hypothetical protein
LGALVALCAAEAEVSEIDVGCDEVDELGGDEETAEMEGDEEVLLNLETFLLLGGIRGFSLRHSRP